MYKFKTVLIVLLSPFLTLANNGKQSVDEKINSFFEPIANWWINVVLYPLTISEEIKIPIILILLVAGALIFTIAFKFINIRKFGLAINVVRGHYEDIENSGGAITSDTVRVEGGDIKGTIKNEGVVGEVTHFQALTSAVSGTVGLGNIAGVAVAIVMGGPGATFWMVLAGLLSMSTKFVECTLGVKYRDVDADGRTFGGPMYYLTKGFREIKQTRLGRALAYLFAILAVGASFGGGNMFQSNQAAAQLVNQFHIESGFAGTLIGIIMAVLVGLVIVGGIKRIGSTTEKIVPVMAGLYILASLIIIFMNIGEIGSAFSLIFSEAFSPKSVSGGFLGVIITGFRRASFSNEAGVGSAAIAHSAVRTRFPASEGIVALMEPFIDTVVICTMTALVIIFTGNYTNVNNLNGVELTTAAFDSSIPGFSYVLTIAIVLFAFSTMITWSYYGVQAWMFLFGKSKKNELTFKIIFLVFAVIGAASSLDAVIMFSDGMILALVFPNMIGLFFLYPKVRDELKRYLAAIKTKD